MHHMHDTSAASTLCRGDMFIKAAHYFGDSSPTSFWSDVSVSSAAQHFLQIKEDGFNTVILLVPVADFVSSANGLINIERRWLTLQVLMNMCNDFDLKVILRVGYSESTTHGLTTVDNGMRRCRRMLMNDSDAWLEWNSLVSRLRDMVFSIPSYLFSFITWEDFSCALLHWPEGAEKERIAWAANSGFRRFVFYDFTNTSTDQWRQNERDEAAILDPRFESLPIPLLNATPHLRVLYLKFVNHLWRSLVHRTRSLMPELGFESRLDSEPVVLPNGQLQWWRNELLEHDVAVRCGYWSPSYLASPVLKVTAEQALNSLKVALEYYTVYGSYTKFILDQFNFQDNTPDMGIPSITNEGLNEFIVRSAALLETYSSGYGIWAYRNYRQTVVHNGYFETGMEGWNMTGCCLLRHQGANVLKVKEKVVLSQSTIVNMCSKQTFCLTGVAGNGTVNITVGLNERIFQLSQLPEYCIQFQNIRSSDGLFVTVYDGGHITFKGIQFFCHEHHFDMYGVAGEKLSNFKYVRLLNALLPASICSTSGSSFLVDNA